ncbi:MAG: ATP-binding protein [Candidatus Electrothrix aestuarii]|uniref:ATP-binding protein n=1 Tax=Candidatus Electrothrix aestuarii TaxID=3062594 RepID=A0AAU8LPR2_9BACT|nr:ATP-binding protein [Candidatus Electrothrix aestuarii]
MELDDRQGRALRFVDIAGMEELKKTLRLRIIEPFQRPELFTRFRKGAGGGVLLYGPPGCGKTMIARAVAGECGVPFHAVGISQVLNMWVGESEKQVAKIFTVAREKAPSILFFDELDALGYSRSKARSDHTRTLVNEFLAQLDGAGASNERLLILAATNMPWDIDTAMKRPGRFSRQLFISPPDEVARAEIFHLKLKDVPCDAIDYGQLAALTPLFSGADIDGVVEYAKDEVLAEIIEQGAERNITQNDLEQACRACRPTTLDWLDTVTTMLKYGGDDSAYSEVKSYLQEMGKL